MNFERSNHNPGAILNRDNDALAQYKKAKKRLGKIDRIEERIDHLESLILKLIDINSNK